MNTNIPRLSCDLKRILKTHEALSILDLWGVGWMDGGCLVLANAMRRWLDAGELLGVWEMVPLVELDPTGVHYRILKGMKKLQHHAILSINDWLIDSDGITTKQGLLKRWDSLCHHRVELQDFDWDDAFEQGMCSQRDMESRVMVLLDSKFNRRAVIEALKNAA